LIEEIIINPFFTVKIINEKSFKFINALQNFTYDFLQCTSLNEKLNVVLELKF